MAIENTGRPPHSCPLIDEIKISLKELGLLDDDIINKLEKIRDINSDLRSIAEGSYQKEIEYKRIIKNLRSPNN